ncbi:UNVERIFIED_CONTAM: hypothetical protein C4Z64_01490 [Clostridioides difficile]
MDTYNIEKIDKLYDMVTTLKNKNSCESNVNMGEFYKSFNKLKIYIKKELEKESLKDLSGNNYKKLLERIFSFIKDEQIEISYKSIFLKIYFMSECISQEICFLCETDN